ncbi:MAG: class I SAM-dependent rRNA methyltransferase [Deltaproteobacteria bacterium]|nr:class I SAM-dependent rRNA methyltransferase [Deltaproteobacteria bacterium]MBN2671815.1 class I SAM-dependent rRNA methyltransferase [Deltaproteobacteria bacterium]
MTLSSTVHDAAVAILKKLETAIQRRQRLISQWGDRTTAYRLVNSGADGFSGLTVDRLGPCLLVEVHRREIDSTPLVSALEQLFADTPIFIKHRWSRSSEKRSGFLAAGPQMSPNFEVLENGLRFQVRLADDEHIGLFLDSRLPREWVAAHSRDRRVLNLFSYTGGFGMAAAMGGARSTVNIDNKNSALTYARQNYERNRLSFDQRTFFKCDVLYYLKRAASQKGRFDLIILDPPPRFKRRRQRDFLAHRDYAGLLVQCVSVLAPNGIILAGLNALKADDTQLTQFIADAAHTTHTRIQTCDILTAHADFPPTEDRPTSRFAILEVTIPPTPTATM